MRTSCVIDTFQQGRFVVEAVESALNQTTPFDEIIVVDDGSRDQSPLVLKQRFGGTGKIRLIFRKRNEGQLACLQTGILSSSGDVVCLLDGDDTYRPEYLASVLDIYDRFPNIDSVFTACEALRTVIERRLRASRDQLTGYSIVLSMLDSAWIGGPTSCLSFRRAALESILPYPHLSDWKTRADDFLNLGTSIAGVQKYYLADELVDFRWHEENSSLQCSNIDSKYRRRIGIHRMLQHLCETESLDPERLVDLAHREFATWSDPSFSLMLRYLVTIFRERRQLTRAIAQSVSILGRFARCRLFPKRHGTSAMSYVPEEIRTISTVRANSVKVPHYSQINARVTR